MIYLVNEVFFIWKIIFVFLGRFFILRLKNNERDIDYKMSKCKFFGVLIEKLRVGLIY